MSRIKDFISRQPINQIMLVAGSTLGGFLLKAFFEKIIPINAFSLYCLTVSYVLVSIIAIFYFIQEFRKHVPDLGLSTEVHIRSHNNDDSSIYKPLTEAFVSANESLYVVSLFRGAKLEVTTARKKHYQDLKKMLETKRKTNPDFVYERIIQTDNDASDILQLSQIDSLSLEHCQYLINLRQSEGYSPRIRLSKIRTGLSPISFAIIDKKKILFMIPAVKLNDMGKLDSSRHIGTLVIIDHPNEKLIKEMMFLFGNLSKESTHISRIDSTVENGIEAK